MGVGDGGGGRVYVGVCVRTLKSRMMTSRRRETRLDVSEGRNQLKWDRSVEDVSDKGDGPIETGVGSDINFQNEGVKES